MVTRRVNGPIYVPCSRCHRRLGPFSRVTSGLMKCGHCGNVFNVRI
jgi:ribosomal protein L37AE/L43A